MAGARMVCLHPGSTTIVTNQTGITAGRLWGWLSQCGDAEVLPAG